MLLPATVIRFFSLVGNALEAVPKNEMVHISTEVCRFFMHSIPNKSKGNVATI